MGEKEIKYNVLSKGVKNFLQKRGIQSQHDLDFFVNPTIEKLALPGKDTLKIAESLYHSIRQGKKIFVWGDEDVDGITSTFLLYEGLKKLNAKVEWHIPSRATEGYGLNKNGIDMIMERGGEVIVTVDCGITSFEEAEYSKSLGIELIITDHHEPRNTLPQAMIVNPKVNDVGYRHLAGVGVALKFSIGIVRIATGLNPVEFIKTMPDSIIFAMIGTITDRVPRLSENRILVVEGEKYLHKSKRPPFMVLAEKTTNDLEEGLRPLQAGRERLTREFFLCNDEGCAREIYEKLSLKSQKYLSMVEKVFEPVKKELLKGNYAVYVPMVTHEYLGSCATRGRDITGMPVFVLTDSNDEVIGEGRGPDDFNLLTVLNEAKHLLISYGGHKPACGFKMRKETVKKFLGIANRMLSEYKPSPKYDSLLEPDELNQQLINLLKLMEPFGKGNEEPVFLIKNAEISLMEGKMYIKGAKIPTGTLIPPPIPGFYDIFVQCNGNGCNLINWKPVEN